MTTAVLVPSGATVSHTGTESYTGGSANYTNLSDASDSTYYRVTYGSGSPYFVFPLGTIPTDINTVTGISITVRGSRSTKGDYGDAYTCQIVKSDGTTAISALVTGMAFTSSAADYTYTPAVTLDTLSDWLDAHIRFDNDSGTSTGPAYYEISVTITYTPVSGGPVDLPIIHGFQAPRAATSAGDGAATWSSTSNVLTKTDLYNDSSFATAIIPASSVSDTIAINDFGFNIPTDATIVGIEALSWSESDSPTYIFDSVVKLYKAGAPVGSNYADGSGWATHGSSPGKAYGGAADLWGTTWTPAQINASDFGIGISVSNTYGGSSLDARLGVVAIRVRYTVDGLYGVAWSSGDAIEIVRPLAALDSDWTSQDPTVIDDVLYWPQSETVDELTDGGSGNPQWSLSLPASDQLIYRAKLWLSYRITGTPGHGLIQARLRLNGNWYASAVGGAYVDATTTWYCIEFLDIPDEAAIGSAPAFEITTLISSGSAYLEAAYVELYGSDSNSSSSQFFMFF